MNSNEYKRAEKMFAKGLREMIKRCYCLGGASVSEIKLAHCDFLADLVDSIIVDVPDKTICPPRR